MTYTYLHVRNNDPDQWTDKYFEISGGNRITRMVTITSEGVTKSNSVAIMAHRNAAYADAQFGGEAPCIVGGFPSPDDYPKYWSDAGCTFEVITLLDFQRRFMQAKPDLGATL